MKFHVGQKVVRVGGDATTRPDVRAPKIGEVVTVSAAYGTVWGDAIQVCEYPIPSNKKYGEGMMAAYFRPAVTPKTDISIFTKILDDVKKREPEKV